MYTDMHVFASNLPRGMNLDTAGQLIGSSFDPLGWVSVTIHDCSNGAAVSFPAAPARGDYQVLAVPDSLRWRAAAVGIRADHALMRAFDADTRLVIPIPLYKNPRRLRELRAASDSRSELRIDRAGARVFRSLFPTRVTDVRLSRILRAYLPRVYARASATHSQYTTV